MSAVEHGRALCDGIYAGTSLKLPTETQYLINVTVYILRQELEVRT
jgi:hypothetical protein